MSLKERLTQIADRWLLPDFSSEKDKEDMVQEIIDAMTAGETTTIADVKAAMSVKLKKKSTGYEATVKGFDPRVVVAKCVQAHTKLVRMRDTDSAPTDTNRADLPILILQPAGSCPTCNGFGRMVELQESPTIAGMEAAIARGEGDQKPAHSDESCQTCKGRKVVGERWMMRHGGGESTPFLGDMEALERSFPIQVDLTLNTKGVGWEVTARADSDDMAVALIRATEDLLRAAFAPKA